MCDSPRCKFKLQLLLLPPSAVLSRDTPTDRLKMRPALGLASATLLLICAPSPAHAKGAAALFGKKPAKSKSAGCVSSCLRVDITHGV